MKLETALVVKSAGFRQLSTNLKVIGLVSHRDTILFTLLLIITDFFSILPVLKNLSLNQLKEIIESENRIISDTLTSSAALVKELYSCIAISGPQVKATNYKTGIDLDFRSFPRTLLLA